jgi:hypothetical protein
VETARHRKLSPRGRPGGRTRQTKLVRPPPESIMARSISSQK